MAERPRGKSAGKRSGFRRMEDLFSAFELASDKSLDGKSRDNGSNRFLSPFGIEG
jgi:hypothetical protein